MLRKYAVLCFVLVFMLAFAGSVVAAPLPSTPANIQSAAVFNETYEDAVAGVVTLAELTVEIGSNQAATLDDLSSVHVSGPNGFSYDFVLADIYTPASEIAPSSIFLFQLFESLESGLYTFTVTDAADTTFSKTTQYVTSAAYPIVDTNTLQLQRIADPNDSGNRSSDSYRISWAPIEGYPTAYYRIRAFDATTGKVVSWGTRKQQTYDVIPVALMESVTSFSFRIEASDGPSMDLTFNRSRTENVDFVPDVADYNASEMVLQYPGIVRRTLEDGREVVAAWLNIPDLGPTATVELIEPDESTTHAMTWNALAQSYIIEELDTTQMPSGIYTFHVSANGLDQYAYDTLDSIAAHPMIPTPDSSTYQVIDYGSFLRFSWADVDYPETLYYRVRVENAGADKYMVTSRKNSHSADLNKVNLQNYLGYGSSPLQWHVQAYNSEQFTTATRSSKGPLIDLSPVPVEADRIWTFGRPSHRFKTSGLQDNIGFEATSPAGKIKKLKVEGPNGFFKDLLAEGSVFKYFDSKTYYLNFSQPLETGLYTFTAVDDNPNVSPTVSYNYLTTPLAEDMERVDYRSFHLDYDMNGDLVFSWAPIHKVQPCSYAVVLETLADYNGDGFPDSVYEKWNIVGTSTVIDVVPLPDEPMRISVRARDSVSGIVENNRSYSALVGVEAPGFDYSTLVDLDGDGLVSNLDKDDRIVTVTSPNGSESIASGADTTITWDSNTGADFFKIFYSLDNGASWILITKETNPDARSITVPAPILTKSAKKTLVKVIAYAASGTKLSADISDETFTIEAFAFVSPALGDVLTSGNPATAEWTPLTGADHYELMYSVNDGKTWSVAGSTPDFTITSNKIRNACLLKVIMKDAADQTLVTAVSDAFTVEPSVKLTSLNGGEVLQAGDLVNVDYIPGLDTARVKINFSTDGGLNWTEIDDQATEKGNTFAWTVPNVSSANCLISVSAFNLATNEIGTTQSSVPFKIKALSFVAPIADQVLTSGELANIAWVVPTNAASFKLQYRLGAGTPWILAQTQPGTTSPIDWAPPFVKKPVTDVQLKMTAYDAGDVKLENVTSAAFTLAPPAKVSLIYPDGGQVLASGGATQVTWSAPSMATNFKVQYTTDNAASWTTLPIVTGANFVDMTLPQFSAEKTQCKFKVSAYTSDMVKMSTSTSDYLTIVGNFALTAPTAADSWVGGSLQDIAWDVNGVVGSIGSVKIQYTNDGGKTWVTAANLTEAAELVSPYSWDVPLYTRDKNNCKIKITIKDMDGAVIGKDTSDIFAITALYSRATMNGTYLMVEQDVLFDSFGSSARISSWGSSATATFDGAGACSLNYTGGDSSLYLHLTDNFASASELPENESLPCLYNVSSTGAVSSSLGVIGTVNPDGSMFIMGPEDERGSSLIFGIKTGTGMTLASLNGSFYMIEQDLRFSDFGDSARINSWGSKATVTFDGAGLCSVTYTGADMELYLNLTDDTVTYSEFPEAETVPCTYTVSDTGAVNSSLGVFGTLSADGSTLLMGPETGATGLMVGIKTATGLNEASLNGKYYMVEQDLRLDDLNDVARLMTWGAAASLTFDGVGTCSVQYSGSEAELQLDLAEESSSINTISERGIEPCTYTVSDSGILSTNTGINGTVSSDGSKFLLAPEVGTGMMVGIRN